jgi:AcrR family transcriptional regulator
LSRKERKERTRQRLIDAAIEILRHEGIEGLTTTRLANAAGITQPAFYVHFKNVDDCLRVTAEQLFERLNRLQAESRRKVYEGIKTVRDLGRADIVAAAFDESLKIAMAEPRFMELFLRYRRDTSSPLGESMRKAQEKVRRGIADDGWRVAERVGISEMYRARFDTVADFILWLYLGAVEALLDERAEDREVVIGFITRATSAAIMAELEYARVSGTSDRTI